MIVMRELAVLLGTRRAESHVTLMIPYNELFILPQSNSTIISATPPTLQQHP